MKTCCVIGLGRFGAELAVQLAHRGVEVLAVDRDRRTVEAVADDVREAVAADCRERSVLQELGVGDMDCAVVAIGGDLATSVLTIMNLKSLGVKRVIAKVYDETHREVALKLGADEAIIPESLMASRLAASLSTAHARDFLPLSDDYGIEEIDVPVSWRGRTLGELRIRGAYGVSVIAVKRGERVLASPGANDRLEADDTLVVVGSTESLGMLHSVR